VGRGSAIHFPGPKAGVIDGDHLWRCHGGLKSAPASNSVCVNVGLCIILKPVKGI